MGVLCGLVFLFMNVRIFAAIELPQSVRERVGLHINQLKATVPACNPSWSRLENIHVTVKFFGNVDQSKIKQISAAAARATEHLKPFDILITGAGAFPKPSQPRVLWIGTEDPSGQVSVLHSRFEEECAKEGFEKEGRGFRPHLTIARIRKPEGARRLAEVNKELGFEPVKLVVNELVIFRSELSSSGSKYTALSRHLLA
jgi:2'-5' RNA ligase